jgi:arabinofuranan 3-O-arabinosyltransferase
MQALGRSDWVIDNGLPLGSVGSARVLDSLSRAIRLGGPSEGLAETLARSGIDYVVVRNDIDTLATFAPSRSVARAVLASSPNLTRVAAFGSVAPAGTDEVVRDFDRELATPAVEIFRVSGEVPRVAIADLSDAIAMTGGPESLMATAALGLIERDDPVVFTGDLPPGLTLDTNIVTDGLMRRDRALGRGSESLSAVLTADAASRLARRQSDLVPFAEPTYTVATFRGGVADVTASTSRAFADSVGALRSGSQPYAAVDGLPRTWWESGAVSGPVGQWLEIRLRQPADLRGTTLSVVQNPLVGSQVTAVDIETDNGSWREEVGPDGSVGPLRDARFIDADRLRITAIAATGSVGEFGIREVDMPGLEPSMPLLTPSVAPGSDIQGIVLEAREPGRAACVQLAEGVRCDPGYRMDDVDGGVLDRLVSIPAVLDGSWDIEGAIRSGLPAAELFDPVGAGLVARASSWLGDDVRVRPSAAVDGSDSTAWVADVLDPRPRLTLTWNDFRTLTAIRIVPLADGQRFAKPVQVTIDAGGQSVTSSMGVDGRILIPPVNARSLTLEVEQSTPIISVQSGSGAASQMPVAIAEVVIEGSEDLVYKPDLSATTGAVCGFGPALTVGSVTIPTRVETTLGGVLQGQDARVIPCGWSETPLGRGTHRIRLDPSPLVNPTRLAFTSEREQGPTDTRALRVTQWSDTAREVQLGPGDAALLRVAESSNPGWSATISGQPLEAVRIDGWQQGWLIPEGTGGTIRMDFAPASFYGWGISAGFLAAAAAVMVGLVFPGRGRGLRIRSPRGMSKKVALPVVAGAGAVLGGPVGLAVAAVASAVGMAVWAPVVAMACVGAGVVARILGVTGGIGDYLMLAGVMCAVTAAIVRSRG